MTAMCKDPEMIKAYREGRDLYASIASIAYNKPYEDCLEFYLDENGNKTDKVNKEGKERRDSAKSIFLGVLYGRGINSIAEQLRTTKQKAQIIQNSIFREFPAIKQFTEDSLQMAASCGYVTTFWGRKRRLPDMQLPEYEFKWKPGYGDIDPLSFDTDVISAEVPYDIVDDYTYKLNTCAWKDKPKIKEQALKEGIIITDNGGKIADATRQVVNSRIQGSAADMSKIAGINIHNNKRLNELGFKLLVPIHDEYLGECRFEDKDECVELFKQCMCDAAKETGLPIKVDVVVSYEWYGEAI
jgi:DNA polymerase I-like protein with 3'-5' exonuclease and polymerase domains